MSIKVDLFAGRPQIICAKANDRFYLMFEESGGTGKSYTVALTLQSGIEMLALLEQARQFEGLPSATPVDEPLVVPPKNRRN